MAPPEDDAIELDAEKRRWVDEVFPRLDEMTHYELLGVDPRADVKAVKAAYYARAAICHPDRHFKKNLGSYRAKMEAIFVRISGALDVLSDDVRRTKYDRTLAKRAARAPTPSTPAPAPALPQDPRELARKQEAQRAAMEALKQRFVDGKAKIAGLVQTAERAKAAGDFGAAADAYKRALELRPDDPALKAAYAEVAAAVSARLVDGHVKKAILAERFGRWAEAAEAWRQVVMARPYDSEAYERLGQALAKAAERG